MAKGKIWKLDFVINTNVHEFHLWLAEDIDKEKLKVNLRKGANTHTL